MYLDNSKIIAAAGGIHSAPPTCAAKGDASRRRQWRMKAGEVPMSKGF